jgi:hypothetical protein
LDDDPSHSIRFRHNAGPTVINLSDGILDFFSRVMLHNKRTESNSGAIYSFVLLAVLIQSSEKVSSIKFVVVIQLEVRSK